MSELNRRKFIKAAAVAGAFTIVPRYVLGGAGNTPPSKKLNIAGIGIGGGDDSGRTGALMNYFVIVK